MAKFKIFLITSLIFFTTVVFVGYVFAQTTTNQTDNTDEVEDLLDEIEKYKAKLDALASRENSLAKEIEYADTQINLTLLRIQSSIRSIQEKEKQIKKLSGDIDDLSKRIVKLEESINYQNSLLKERLREKYKVRENSIFMVLFGAKSLNDVVKKAEYLTVTTINDSNLLDEMEQTKNDYNDQKNIYEETKENEEKLKKQLEIEKANQESYKVTLENQKEEKKHLLEITQNDEKKYQELLEEAQKELNQITGAVAVLKNKQAVKVKQGEVIGYQGNTGYSSGEHLHFGVYKYDSFQDIDGWNWYYSNYIDPAKVLKSKTVYWNTGCESPGNRSTGKGDWMWPISSPTISQGFGTTCWSNRLYGGKPHPALDMYGTYGTPVYAVEDGDAYYCKNCLGDGGNGVFIFHDDGYMTLYWHLR